LEGEGKVFRLHRSNEITSSKGDHYGSDVSVLYSFPSFDPVGFYNVTLVPPFFSVPTSVAARPPWAKKIAFALSKK
jgi:hypothetical protein